MKKTICLFIAVTMLGTMALCSCSSGKISSEYIKKLNDSMIKEDYDTFNELLGYKNYNLNSSPYSFTEKLFSFFSMTPYSALETACYLENYYFVNELIKNSANPNYSASGGLSPLYVATIYMGSSEGLKNAYNIITLLLENGADPNFSFLKKGGKDTPLMNVARTLTYEDSVRIAKALLDYGADKTLQNRDGRTAYDYAVENGNAELAELLKP